MAEKINKSWYNGIIAAINKLAQTFGIAQVSGTADKKIVVDNFSVFNKAMNTFSTDEYLSQTKNESNVGKEIRYTAFSGKVGEKISSAIKTNIENTVASWQYAVCRNRFVCQKGTNNLTCSRGSAWESCEYGWCSRGTVTNSNGTNNKSYKELCKPDGSCKAKYNTYSCSSNGSCSRGNRTCTSYGSNSNTKNPNQRQVTVDEACAAYGTCSNTYIYDIRCANTTQG